MPVEPIVCPICNAIVTQIGLMYGLGDQRVRRTLICAKGHALEDGAATSVRWSQIAKEEGLYDKLADSELLPYDSLIIASRVDGHWRVFSYADRAVGEPAYPVSSCKFCKSTNVSLIKDGKVYVLSCDNCDAYGPEGTSFAEAANKWNAADGLL